MSHGKIGHKDDLDLCFRIRKSERIDSSNCMLPSNETLKHYKDFKSLCSICTPFVGQHIQIYKTFQMNCQLQVCVLIVLLLHFTNRQPVHDICNKVIILLQMIRNNLLAYSSIHIFNALFKIQQLLNNQIVTA